MIKVVKRIAFFGAVLWSVSAHAEGRQAAEIMLSNSDYLLWDGQGQYFNLCDSQKKSCLKLKMPKDLMPIQSLSYTTNMDKTRATWLVSSGKRNFICAVLPNSATVRCTKVLNAPQDSRSVKKANVTKKNLAESRAILDGELALARYHSSGAGVSGASVCTDCESLRDEQKAAEEKCDNEAKERAQEHTASCLSSSSGIDSFGDCMSGFIFSDMLEELACNASIPFLPMECWF